MGKFVCQQKTEKKFVKNLKGGMALLPPLERRGFPCLSKFMNNASFFTINDLYTLSEKEIINRFINCKDKYLANAFKNFQTATKVYKSDKFVKDKYCVNVKSKTRYIVPLAFDGKSFVRINTISEIANKKIEKYLYLPKGGYYTYFDFEFTPYNTKKI